MLEADRWLQDKEEKGEIIDCELMSAKMHKCHCCAAAPVKTTNFFIERRVATFCSQCQENPC
jgi:hypothetical protein